MPKDIFSTAGLDKSGRHKGDKAVHDYLKGRWITRKQFDKLSAKQLEQIGKYNKGKNHHPKPSVVGKTNDDYKYVNGKKVLKSKGKK